MSSNGRSKRSPVAERRYAAAQASAAGASRGGGGSKTRQGKAKPAKTARRGKRRGSGRGRGGPIGLLAAFVAWIIGILWSVGWRITALVALVIGGAVLIDYGRLPPSSDLIDGRTRGSVTLLDRDGKVFAWRGDQFGGAITADTVSPNLKAAIVATEDRRFYQHLGVDPRGILGAIRINLSEGRSALEGHGGSTITQQTAKLLCAGTPYDPTSGQTQAEYEAQCREGSLTRKIREAIYALAMETRYSKDEILTVYMNRVYLGEGTNGFEAASQRYFGKSAAEVDPAESAMLAGLLVAPTRYAPTNDLERSQDRASVIIGLMQQQGYLTAAQADEARKHPAELSDAAQARAGGYFADWLMSSAPSWLGSETTEDVVMQTTFDPELQRDAEAGLKHVFDTKISPDSKAQAAIVVMSADGAVRAMVGGRKTKVSGAFNRATQAMRQTGSAFKPFIYATALDLGYTYQATVVDEPLTLNVPGSGNWSPQNYTRDYAGRVTLLQALEHSLNIPAVKVQEAVGRDNVRHVAEDFGIRSDLAAGPAMALGTSEATLLETTGAYAGILNGGSRVTPYGLTRVTLMGDSEPIIDKQGGIGERVISQEAAQQLVYMMYNVIEHGTGGRAKLAGRPAAGKTGTTQSARDAWFIGFTGDYVTGVWLGNDDNTPLKGVTGGGLPAEIWHEVMARVSDGTPVTPLPMIQPSAPVALAEIGGGQQQRTAAPTPQEPQREERRDDPLNVAERVLHDVIGNIFGRRN